MATVNLTAPRINETLNTFFPQFIFDHDINPPLDIEIQIATDEAFTAIVQSTSYVSDPAEWAGIDIGPGVTINFTFPEAKMIAPNGTYFWRVIVWGPVGVPNVSEIRQFTIAEAAYRFRLFDGVNTVYLPIARDGVKDEMILTGCSRQEKHIFKIQCSPFDKDMYDDLKAMFDLNIALTFYDNANTTYSVYWGECERAVSGDAFPPKEAAFGIVMCNFKSGALRWDGEIVLTEI